jgi:hypothetical protein
MDESAPRKDRGSWDGQDLLSEGNGERRAEAVTRVNSTNVLDEGLRIGEIGRRMNSKVKSVKQGLYQK